MASSTYLQLTNELLRRLLENELDSTDFASARSTQAVAKDMIRTAVSEIYTLEKEWPFQYNTATQVLTVGTTEYNLPTDCKTPDWESFYIVKDDTLGVNTTPLRMISRDQWMKKFRPDDYNAGSDGLNVPAMVFDSSIGHTRSFGVTPSPNEAYTVGFEYYRRSDDLEAYDDEVLIPSQYNYVIIAGALKHFNAHKDNLEQLAYWDGEFKKAVNSMRHDLIPKKDDVISTVINFGGSSWKSSPYGRY